MGCKPWCCPHSDPWEKKCKWKNCKGCSSCTSTMAPSAAPTATPTVAPTPAPTLAPTPSPTTTSTTTTSTTKAPTTIGGYSVHPGKVCHVHHGAHRIVHPGGNRWIYVQKNEANAESCRAECDANADCIAIGYRKQDGECHLYDICPVSSVVP